MNHPPLPFHICRNCFELRSAHTDDEVASCPFAPTTFALLLFTPYNDVSDGSLDAIREELGVHRLSASQQLLQAAKAGGAC